MYTNPKTYNSSLAWISVVLLIVVLVLLGVVISQINEINDQTAINSSSNTAEEVDDMQLQATIDRAGQQLADVRNQIAQTGDEGVEQVQNQVAQIRQDLRKGFENADENAQQSWQEIDKNLEIIENDLRDGAISALDGLDRATDALKQEIRQDD
ncbi:MAG: hypothetical protein ACOZAN_04165 [Patescibacteria group bacterium]